MALVLLWLLLLILFVFSIEATSRPNQFGEIHLGSQLSPTSNTYSWLSPSGHFAFGFYQQGNGFAIGIWLVGQPNNTVIWTANRDDPPVSSSATIHFTKEGELLLRTDQEGNEKLIANVSEKADSASMLDSGNFVLYGDSHVIWRSFDFPTDTILGGQNLSDVPLVSSASSSNHSAGRFYIQLQTDGNLVAYPLNSAPRPVDSYWSTNTAQKKILNLHLSRQGSLLLNNLYQSKPLILASSSYPCKNKTTIYRATLDPDGIFRLYSHCFQMGKTSYSLRIEWSALNNQCEVHGFCEFNSYCSGMGTHGACFCYPGFGFIDPNEKSSGCYNNVSDDSCADTKQQMYNVTVLENMWLSQNPYSFTRLKKESCASSCLEDCDCWAALHINNTCQKYATPIRYGRHSQSISSTAFFKVRADPRPTPPPPQPISPKVIVETRKSLITFLAIILGSIAFLCFVIAICTFFMYRDRTYLLAKLSGIIGLAGDFTLRSFSYNELEKATDGFREELGRGSIGAVYRGTIPGGDKTVAVQRLEKVVDDEEKKFRAEITVIGQTYHRNLVRLLGFCVEGSRRLLVYEFLKNGTLSDLLFKAERRPTWKERVRVALDIARGILYLHEECEACIIHCNITPQNILMDDSWTAKISDFGLSKLLCPDKIRSSMAILSHSRGHLAPEWQTDALISVKTDIYSFGVVLLEIVSCRSCIKTEVSTTADEMILSSWAYQCFVAGQLDNLVKDEHIEYESLERIVKVGLWCVQNDPSLRPSIKNVILMLEGSEDVPNPPSLAPFLISS